MKFFDHTIYASTKIDRHDKTSALSVPSVVDTYQYSYRVNIYSGSETAWTLEKQTTFTYDDWNLIEEQTSSGSDISLTNSAFTQFRTSNYTYDANGNGLEEALYEGFAFELIDTAGVVKAHYEYSPFGKVVHKSGPLADKNPFQFSTKYLDNETQLYYYGLRYYNPENGHWINRDPIQERGGINIYGLVQNAPIYKVDYLGMSEVNSTFNNKFKPKLVFGEYFYDFYKSSVLWGAISGMKHSGTAAPSDTTLILTTWTKSVVHRILYPSWGKVTVKSTINIICDKEGEIDTSTTGFPSRTDSIAQGLNAWTTEKSGAKLTIYASSSASSRADSPGSVEIEKGPVKIGVAWPGAAYANTFDMGTFKWECVCQEK